MREEENQSMLMKTNPSEAVKSRAMRSRKGVVAVIVAKPPSPPETEPETEPDMSPPETEPDMHFGSGFVIKDGPPRSLVLTCEHLVEGALSVWIRRTLPAGGVEELPAEVIQVDGITNIALLGVLGLSGKSLALDIVQPWKVNESVITMGYFNPEDLLDADSLPRLPGLSPGCIWEPDRSFIDKFGSFMEKERRELGMRRIGTFGGVKYDCILLNFVNTHGVSGGPVLNKHGVIGMSSKMGADMPMSLAVSSKTILRDLCMFADLTINKPNMKVVVSHLE